MPPRPGSLPGALPPRPGFGAPPPGAFPNGGPDAIQSSIDDLIAGVQKEAPEKKDDKKKKDKNMRLIYNDDNYSPEEKMAKLPRFAEFVRV
jgi:regulator of sirC expression with transglutaminase-like and TPR domain